MTSVPYLNLSDALEIARIGLWIGESLDGQVTLACKAPSSAIKAVYNGAECSLLVFVVDVEDMPILCLGLRIRDETENPLVVFSPSVLPQNQRFVETMLGSTATTIGFFSELGHPVLGCRSVLGWDMATETLRALKPITVYAPTPSEVADTSITEISRRVDLALDLFQKEAYMREGEEPSSSLVRGVIPLKMNVLEPMPVYEVSATGQSRLLQINDQDEGTQLERSLFLTMEAIYPGRTYQSPKVEDGHGRRELTDVLSLTSEADHICLVESKAMSVLHTDASRSTNRRASAVTKQIEKALHQLCGAIIRLRAGAETYDSQGEPILIPDRTSSLVHGIVTVSEMYAFLDWREIARQIVGLSEQARYRALFHVLDLQELRYHGAHAVDSDAFNASLAQRWFEVRLKGTAYLRAKTSPEALRRRVTAS